jgi:hypothetical protein
VRRPAWALPPQPPETWVGGLAMSLLVAAVAVAVLVPLAPVWGGPHDAAMLLAISRAVAGCAAVVAAFALIVQSMVSGNRELTWLAGGFGLV